MNVEMSGSWIMAKSSPNISCIVHTILMLANESSWEMPIGQMLGDIRDIIVSYIILCS